MKNPRVALLLDLEANLITKFFYGVEQNGICGAGMVIYLHPNHKFQLRMGVGLGTSTKAELVALWGLLWFSKQKKCSFFG